jgi:hypothetical protein
VVTIFFLRIFIPDASAPVDKGVEVGRSAHGETRRVGTVCTPPAVPVLSPKERLDDSTGRGGGGGGGGGVGVKPHDRTDGLLPTTVLCIPSHLQPTSYGHRTMNTRLPVRSALVKHGIARLVLQWVTMRESLVP